MAIFHVETETKTDTVNNVITGSFTDTNKRCYLSMLSWVITTSATSKLSATFQECYRHCKQLYLTWCMKRSSIRQLDVKLRLQALHQIQLLEWRSEIGFPRIAIQTVGMIYDLSATSNGLHHPCISHSSTNPLLTSKELQRHSLISNTTSQQHATWIQLSTLIIQPFVKI